MKSGNVYVVQQKTPEIVLCDVISCLL